MTAANQPDPMTPVLTTFRNPEATDFTDAWVGLEPTFQTANVAWSNNWCAPGASFFWTGWRPLAHRAGLMSSGKLVSRKVGSG